MTRSFFVALALAGAFSLLPQQALAAPYHGVGHAPASEGANARGKALLRARRAALRAALDALVGKDAALPPEAKGKRGSAWTSAYRVLTQAEDGATVTIEVEVEVDTGRLINRYRKAPAAANAGLVLAAVTPGAECGRFVGELFAQALVDRGVVTRGGEGAAVRVELQCEGLGEVSYLRQRGSRVRAVVRDAQGSAVATGSGTGFAEDQDAAISTATDDAAIEVARKLRAQHGEGVLLYLQQAWPAARVRRFERVLRTSFVGAQAVGLSGLSGSGAAVLRIAGPFDANRLAEQLPGMRLPDGQVEVVGIDSPRSLRVRIIDLPDPQPNQP